MNWIDKCTQADKCATIENCKISLLLFADDFVLLSSTESGLQRALNSLQQCRNENKHVKTEVLHLSRNPDQCVLQVNGATLKQVKKFKCLGGCIHEWRKAKRRTAYPNWQGQCSNASFALFGCHETRIVKKAKLSIVKTVFVPILTYGHESNDQKSAITSASVRNEVFTKNRRSYTV